MKQSKLKQVTEKAIRTNWIYKLFKLFSKDKTKDLCSGCKKNKPEAMIEGNKLCLECISNYNKQEKSSLKSDV